jgi:cytochrome b561
MAALSTHESNVGDDAFASGQVVKVQSTRKSFDGVIIAFHWATVIIVLGLLTTALIHTQSRDDITRVLMLRIHRSLGVTIWLVTVSRLVWRLTQAKLPPFPTAMSVIHRTCVTVGEYCLYALLVIQPMTGFGATITRGRTFPLFWWHVPPLMPRYPVLENALFLAHRIGAWTLIVLITGHAVAALVHHFLLRDEVLARMAPIAVLQRRSCEASSDTGEAQALLEG